MNNITSKMKLIEALEILRSSGREDALPLRIALVCSFTPLHLQTFLKAQCQLAFQEQKVEVVPGLYGDLVGNLEKARVPEMDAALVFLEWADFDPRLGLRSLGNWSPSAFPEIKSNAFRQAAQFLQALEQLSLHRPVVACFPTIPLPPISFVPGWQASVLELELRACVASLELRAAQLNNVSVVSRQRLDEISPLRDRFDAKAELASGFPYRIPHASAIAEMVTQLLQRKAPKKALITDLDDTLWSGILGELGVTGICWDLQSHAHMHGAYQRLLHALSEAGVLIGVASKNDPQLVLQALEREDLIVSQDVLFPVHAHWRPKSESVGQMLKLWNIGADSVVFVDDSPMELAEVKSVHPGIECVLFEKDNPQKLYELFQNLRDQFGKNALSEEDNIRRDSIRNAHQQTKNDGGHEKPREEFLLEAQAEVTYSFSKEPSDPRALELVNKTNQFNLNGKRFTEMSWQSYLKQDNSFLMVVSYRDKYGPLGKIAVLAGRHQADQLALDVWVMSCRAFSRRIEYRSLQELFQRFNVAEIALDFQKTERNGPLREFLEKGLKVAPLAGCRILRSEFMHQENQDLVRVGEAGNG